MRRSGDQYNIQREKRKQTWCIEVVDLPGVLLEMDARLKEENKRNEHNWHFTCNWGLKIQETGEEKTKIWRKWEINKALEGQRRKSREKKSRERGTGYISESYWE